MSKPLSSRNPKQAKKLDDHQAVKSSRSNTFRSRRDTSTSSRSIRPSSRWTSFEGVGEDRASKIKDIFATADWEFLCSDAVSFSDATYWVVRIRFPDEDDSDIKKLMHSKVATMRLIQEKTSILVPTVFGYNATHYNSFGYKYMFLNALFGHYIAGPLATTVPLRHQGKVADQLADILYQLSTKMVFDRIGRVWRGKNGEEKPSIIPFNACGISEGQYGKYLVGPFSTSLEHFYILRQNENAAVRSAIIGGVIGQDEKEKWIAAYRVLEQGLCSLVLMEKMNGPFPVQHVDLHFNNILFDDDYNITGLIDWSGAQTVPCESFAVCREFIIPPNATEDSAARYSSFRGKVQKAWKRREVNGQNAKLKWSISDVVGSPRAELVYFSYTYGALRRTVIYAELVSALLHGHDFSADAVKAD